MIAVFVFFFFFQYELLLQSQLIAHHPMFIPCTREKADKATVLSKLGKMSTFQILALISRPNMTF